MALRTHLAEHVSMPKDGLSARTKALSDCLDADVDFHDGESFLAGMATVGARLQAHPQDEHLLVICTHGLEDTGTWIHVDAGLQSQRPEIGAQELLRDRPGKLLVCCSVCWGGYPGMVRRFQHGNKPWPAVVGALAPLTAGEGNDLQDKLQNALLKHGFDEARLRRVVEDFNAAHTEEYGHPVARFVSSDGLYVPEQGSAGLAWSLLREEDNRPLLGPYEVVKIDEQRDRAEVRFELSGAIRCWIPCGRLRLAKEGELAIGDRFSFRAKRSPSEAALQVVGDAHPMD